MNLDDDVAHVARQLARQRGTSIGKVIPELVRKAIEPKSVPTMRNRAPLFTPKNEAKKPHLAMVNELRDEG